MLAWFCVTAMRSAGTPAGPLGRREKKAGPGTELGDDHYLQTGDHVHQHPQGRIRTVRLS